MIPSNKRYIPVAALLLFLLLVLITVASCSTTTRLAPGEVRYSGVGKFSVVHPEGEHPSAPLMSELKKAVNCNPHDYLFFPFLKIPVGLWTWNHWPDSAKGVNKWIYDKLVEAPVLIDEVRPEMRVKLLEQILDNNGYFGNSASYEVVPDRRNKKIAAIDYTIHLKAPYRIDSIIYLNRPEPLCAFADSVARLSPYMQKGEIFCVDSLASERIRITNILRNRGYYYFRPEYIEFLADSLITPGSIAVKMTLANNTPRLAMQQYRTGKIVTTVLRNSITDPGIPDTMHTDKGEVIVMRPARLRKNLIPSCITFRPGRLFSVRNMNSTQTRLARLGIFSNIQIQPVPADTALGHGVIDVYTTVQFERPMEVSFEVNASSKSNSYLGPGMIFGISHNNVFGGGERLSLQANADYEWQTGRNRSNVFNSYEFGLNATLAFPRMLAPGFIKRTSRELNWTTISLGASILNRPRFFKLAEFNTGITYEWRAARHSVNQFTPFKITYNKLMSTTHAFDSVMYQNPAVALSFQSQFIPQMSYTYTLDKFLERERINGINFTTTVTEAGNIFSGIWRLAGVKGEKKLFGTPFSQFVKAQAQFVYNRRLIRNTDHWLVSRALIGAEHAYGNSTQVPYSEQFYIGGANSIRAFTVRSIGPGSYRAPKSLRDGYFDQTGTFKIELNSEYRFPIYSILHGAVFVDAGNIWLLKADPLRPGGLLKADTFLRDMALGTGVGLRIDIGMMVIRGDLGYGLHNPGRNTIGIPASGGVDPEAVRVGGGAYFNIPLRKAFAFHLAIGYPF